MKYRQLYKCKNNMGFLPSARVNTNSEYVTVSMRSHLIAYLNGSRKAGFKCLKCYGLLMFVATCTKIFTHFTTMHYLSDHPLNK